MDTVETTRRKVWRLISWFVVLTLAKAGTARSVGVSRCAHLLMAYYEYKSWILAPIPIEYKLPVGTIFDVVAGIDVAPLFCFFLLVKKQPWL